ncbi:chromosomal replication initiator protein DnaA [Actinomyces sp. 2119]|uniref:Chromosomal replication initiator protein DnaA n=1 Tax=Actinomyces lilanjuaniae TaxID=2321394 RepID=A0ABM6Z1Q8_9ACTO|nr:MULTISPECIES: chromosomal replication initiator protein DnaA [Actinomyces]AYD88848.1 chromosomal replication initiator protein DnaA [Actinomyces lilanjuaniae]RJF43847.1 chromosomal replication initiator protein DnaA [Actinomyces sp. 2119]
MPDTANTQWLSALEVLSTSGELGQGKMSMIRMTHVIDVDGTLVLVVGSAFAKDVVEQSRAPIAAAVAQVWGHPVPIEVTVDTSSEGTRLGRPNSPRSQEPMNLATAHLSHDTTPGHVEMPTYAANRTEHPANGTDIYSEAPAARGYAVTTGTAPTSIGSGSPLGTDRRTTTQPQETASSSVTSSAAESTYRSTASLSAVNQSPSSLLTPTAADDISQLNPRYTFDTYVTGSSNRFAHATALAVAEAPARAYNPLFIYGGSGLGKTHLLHAIGHYSRTLNPGIRVKYVNSEVFVSDFIACVRDGNQDDGRMEGFKRRYREVDILLVDDIQFLQGKESTLEEFFHTFNSLHSSGKQVVLTSDQPPKALGGLDERLRSRFEWGLLADVQPPDLETRIAILSRKGSAEGLDLPLDVLEYIASRVTTNIRELEGALIRVTAFASLNKQPVDHTLAEMVLKDLISDPEGQEITASLIMAQTSDYFGITIEDLCSANRSRTIVSARHIAMYLCRELTDLSLPKIGREFGGRDHTTVMSADKKIRTLMAERRSTFNQVTELTSRIKQAAQSPQH